MLKKILILLFIVLLIGAWFAKDKYDAVFSPNVAESLTDPYIYLKEGTTLDDVVTELNKKSILLNESSFRWVANRMNYKDTKVRSGRFKIEPEWSNRRLVRHLRGGQQATVKVVLNNERLLPEVAGKVANVIATDSIQLLNLFNDKKYLTAKGYSKETLMSLFIPNTYDFYWNTTPETFFDRMQKEHKKFWEKDNRLKKAAALNLSKEEVYTLASIVGRETNKNDEKKRIAGVYLNRLRQGILLQADPTVVFATGEFGLRRVLNKHTAIDSPYNTYRYAGLPPGPISMASIASLDAVLNAEKHDYIFFCAKPDYSGYHAFAKTLRGHNENARVYRKWLTKELRK
ncbi:MAG: endolytic transglycosylase MltG [Saprospiraceae bacterium]